MQVGEWRGDGGWRWGALAFIVKGNIHDLILACFGEHFFLCKFTPGGEFAFFCELVVMMSV